MKELGVFASFGVMMSVFLPLSHTSDHQVDPLRKRLSSQFFCSFYGSIFKILSHLSRKYPRFVVATLSLGAVSFF